MNITLKKIAACASSALIIGTAGMSVSAATPDDVVAAARAAGFLEEYVQTLQNFLNTSKFTSSQYDIMVEKFGTIGSEMDDFAMRYFGKTVAEMKGEGSSSSESGDPSGNNSSSDVNGNNWVQKITEKMTGQDIAKILSQISDTGKELGLDVSIEKKADKNYVVTVRDKDGNIQLVTPVGKLVDTTGEESSSDEEGNGTIPAVCAGVAAAGCIGAYGLISKCSKKSKNMRKKNG